MLTSKLILMAFTWGMAFLVSVLLRIAGIVHPQAFEIDHFLVWFLVFFPSVFLLVYFFLKRSLSFDSLI